MCLCCHHSFTEICSIKELVIEDYDFMEDSVQRALAPSKHK